MNKFLTLFLFITFFNLNSNFKELSYDSGFEDKFKDLDSLCINIKELQIQNVNLEKELLKQRDENNLLIKKIEDMQRNFNQIKEDYNQMKSCLENREPKYKTKKSKNKDRGYTHIYKYIYSDEIIFLF